MSTGRSVLGYCLVSRPGDLVKTTILPIGYLLGSAVAGVSPTAHLEQMLLVWVVLELLVYPARYQLNDMLGFEADQRHPGGDRGRLPGPLSRKRRRLGTSGAVAALRLALAAVLVLFAQPRVALLLLLLCGAVLASTVVYELLRAVATGRTGTVEEAMSPGVLGIWMVIGAGYAVRGMGGMVVALGLAGSGPAPVVLVLAAAAWWAFGIAWVTSRWAIEATAHARIERHRLVWRAGAAQAREHLLALVRWLPREVQPELGSTGRWRAVARTRLSAPWHVGGVATGALALAAGWAAADPGASSTVYLVGAVLGALGSAGVAAFPAHRALVAATAAVGLTVAGIAMPLADVSPGVLPWLLATAVQLRYLEQCRDGIGGSGERARRLLAEVLPGGRARGV